MNFRSTFRKIGGLRLVSTDSHLPKEEVKNTMSEDYYCEGCMKDIKEETIFDRRTKLWLCKQCKKEMNNEGTSRN
tara:strand:- start:128 stop:352 length:225 start_codon:yes stop_codon:yes gene_type:complete